jgi:hypothetical protein
MNSGGNLIFPYIQIEHKHTHSTSLYENFLNYEIFFKFIIIFILKLYLF